MTDDKTADSLGHDVEAQILLYEASKKDIWMAYVLGAVLGFVGAHRFYIGGRSTRYGWLFVGLFVTVPVTLLLAFILSVPLALLPAALWLQIVVWDAGLTYFAVRRRNQELLEEARIPQELQVRTPPTRLSIAMERLLVFLAGSLAVLAFAGVAEGWHIIAS